MFLETDRLRAAPSGPTDRFNVVNNFDGGSGVTVLLSK